MHLRQQSRNTEISSNLFLMLFEAPNKLFFLYTSHIFLLIFVHTHVFFALLVQLHALHVWSSIPASINIFLYSYIYSRRNKRSFNYEKLYCFYFQMYNMFNVCTKIYRKAFVTYI
jgi:hypothetical protein